MIDRRWGLVVATPLLAWVVGAIAMPHPTGVIAAQAAFDRSAVADVVKTVAASPSSSVDVTLGKTIQLRGFDGPTQALSRGARLSAILHFAVLADVDTDWQVFVHIDAVDGTGFRINADHWPAGGRYRTGLWRPGEHVVDSFEQTIPVGAPAGLYDVWVGLYRGDKRMPVTGGDRSVVDGDNRVRVGRVVVE